MKKFKELPIETQTIRACFKPRICNLVEVHKEFKDDDKVWKTNNGMKNQVSFYAETNKIYLCNLTSEKICILGVLDDNECFEIIKMVMNKITKITKDAYIIYEIEQVMTNLRTSVGFGLDLEMVEEVFQDNEIFSTSYNPSVNSNLFIEHHLGKINGKNRRMIFTLTRNGSLKISGRKHIDIKPVYIKFVKILSKIMFEAMI